MTGRSASICSDLGDKDLDDTDQVITVLRKTAAALQADPEFGPSIFAPLEVLGVWPASNYRLLAAGGAHLSGLAGAIGVLAILIGASVAQSLSIQYACYAAYLVRVSRVSHFVAPTKPLSLLDMLSKAEHPLLDEQAKAEDVEEVVS